MPLKPGRKAVSYEAEHGPWFGTLDFFIKGSKVSCFGTALNSYERKKTVLNDYDDVLAGSSKS